MPEPTPWMIEAGNPPDIQKLVGSKVTRAYLLSGGCCVLFTIDAGEHGMCIMVEMMDKAPSLKDHYALRVDIGDLYPGANFDDLKDDGAQELEHLVGQEFTGLDGTIVTFGKIGVLFEQGREVQFVKRRGS